MTRLHLDNVAERILKSFQNPGWRQHGLGRHFFEGQRGLELGVCLAFWFDQCLLILTDECSCSEDATT
jgi:hypothetical protein